MIELLLVGLSFEHEIICKIWPVPFRFFLPVTVLLLFHLTVEAHWCNYYFYSLSFFFLFNSKCLRLPQNGHQQFEHAVWLFVCYALWKVTSAHSSLYLHKSKGFNKLELDRFDGPESDFIFFLCCFSRTTFASTLGADTITPIPDSFVPIGQREDMSDIDILRINKLYECSKYRNHQTQNNPLPEMYWTKYFWSIYASIVHVTQICRFYFHIGK